MSKTNETRPIHCTKTPAYNVLSQEEFQKRIEVIFDILDEILGKSFGAFGAPTIIANYPYTHVTKDGFTIARNINFDFVSGEPVDRIIAGMAIDICARLNYAVGDGTTTAIIATNRIYKAAREKFKNMGVVRSRDVIRAFTTVKDVLIKRLQKEATYVTDENLVDVIHDIVNISSNGDEQITKLITDAYAQLRFPSIHTEKSDNADTYCTITTGYPSKVRISDGIYVNNENKTAEHKNVDVIIFDHRVKRATYEKILSPLASMCKYLGRHLLCIAPSYDDEALQTVIRRDLNNEYSRTNDVTLILCSYPASTPSDKKAIADLAMLTGTTLVDKAIENDIIDALSDKQADLRKYINISDRGIEGINIFEEGTSNIMWVADGSRKNMDGYLLNLGFARKFTGSAKDSIFVCENYNESLYQKYLSEAKNNLEDVKKKFEMLGSYTKEIYEAQTRYTSLMMKTATIYVGGDSILSRDLLQDSVDDAVLAAESAYQFGYVQGCNVTLSAIISELLETGYFEEGLEKDILKILQVGFRSVYYRVLSNAYGTDETNSNEDIIDCSIEKRQVWDLSTEQYTDKVINSTKTDIEVLTATMDLLKLLLTGNQMIITNYSHD